MVKSMLEIGERIVNKIVHTLELPSYLASTFWNQSRWKEVEERDVQVMGGEKSECSVSNILDTLTSQANLASTFQHVFHPVNIIRSN